MHIDQNLHGYADGHRLLAGSIDLPRQEKYAVLGLSDMSGRSMVPGFEEYLTGYPLPAASLYAFARTWYAPEMERPGCVWTHTLLLRESDLGEVRDLGAIRRLFRRPNKPDRGRWDEYSLPLEYADRGYETSVTPWMQQPLAFALWGLYGTDLPLFQPAEDARQMEDLLMALWSQQWPSLRFAFRFCSGAIGVRASGGTPFDYQIIPVSSIREARREVPASNAVISGAWTNPPESPDWLLLALDDIGEGGTSFRQFLCDHAGSAFDGRAAFAPLGELFSFWKEMPSNKTLPCLLEEIGRRYPKASSAGRLKQAVAGSGFSLATLLVPGLSEADVLQALSTTAVAAAYDPEKLDVDERARTLWEGDRNGAEALIASLIANDLNPIGERVLLSLIRGMSLEDAVRHADAIPGLVATAVRLNPDHAKSPAVWKGQPEHQRCLFDAATASEISAETQTCIITAMLHAGSDAAAERTARKFGPGVVHTVMNWFDESGLSSPSDVREGWRRVLGAQTATLLDWLAGREGVREPSGALIADLSNPHSVEVHRRGTAPWLKVLASHESSLPANYRNRMCAFLLALGFDAPAGQPDVLIARSFNTVHSAVANSRLGEDSWAWLDDQLPTLAIWRYWDRCERLRRGLAVRFINHEWPVAQFFRCAPDRDSLRDLLKSCDKVDGGNKLFKRIKRALADDDVNLDRHTRELVERYI